MKLDKCSFYQAIELLTRPSKKTNLNTVSVDVIPGVILTLENHLVTISHPDWDEDVFVSTANVRYATAKKDSVLTFGGMNVVVDKNMPENGPDYLISNDFAIPIKKKIKKK